MGGFWGKSLSGILWGLLSEIHTWDFFKGLQALYNGSIGHSGMHLRLGILAVDGRVLRFRRLRKMLLLFRESLVRVL